MMTIEEIGLLQRKINIVAKLLKQKFNNLSAEELIALSFAIVNGLEETK